jgi:CheY-like chemotaxis protein
LAEVYAELADWPAAQRAAAEVNSLADSASEPTEKAQCQVAAVRAAAAADQVAAAEQIVGLIENRHLRDVALSHLAAAYAGAGDSVRAAATAQLIDDKKIREEAEADPKRPDDRVPDPSEVDKARAVDDPTRRGHELSSLAERAARAGDHALAAALAAEAEAAARSATDLLRQFGQAEILAMALCRLGRLDDAARLADYLLPRKRPDLLAEMARVADHDGDPRRAEALKAHGRDLAGQLGQRWRRAVAPAERSGPPADNRTVADRLSRGPWQDLVDTLAQIDPDAVSAVAQEFRAAADTSYRDDPPSGWRVLIMDDSAEVALLLKRLLAPAGHLVALAYDGESGIADAERLRPDLIVTNLCMPFGGEGIAVIERLRVATDVPIILTAGCNPRGSSGDSWTGGADAFLEKPFTRATFCAAINSLIDGVSDVPHWAPR